VFAPELKTWKNYGIPIMSYIFLELRRPDFVNSTVGMITDYKGSEKIKKLLVTGIVEKYYVVVEFILMS